MWTDVLLTWIISFVWVAVLPTDADADFRGSADQCGKWSTCARDPMRRSANSMNTERYTSSTITHSDLHCHQSSFFVSFLLVNDSSVGEGTLEWDGTLPLCAWWTKTQRNSAAYASIRNNTTHLPTLASPRSVEICFHILNGVGVKLITVNSNLTHFFPENSSDLILKSSKNVLLKLQPGLIKYVGYLSVM